MAVKLTALMGEREVSLGQGVYVTIRAVGYAALRSAEVLAFQKANARVADLRDASDMVSEETSDERNIEYRAKVEGIARELMLDAMVADHAISWRGVVDDDGETPMPLNTKNWKMFRSNFGFLADQLASEFAMPAVMIAAEGKR